MAVPASAPPMFGVLAADDPILAGQGFGLLDAWQAARKPVEFHLYQRGGHGFGLGAPATTTIDWMPSFHHWMDASGFLKPNP